MLHIITTIQKQTDSVDIDEEDSNTKVTLNGQEYPIDWRQIAPLMETAKKPGEIGGRYSLLLAGKSYEIFARRITRPEAKNAQIYEIFLNGERFEVNTEDTRAQKLAGSLAAGAQSGKVTIYAPMPGLVVGVLLEVGAEVKAGQSVIVLEAMKMENDLASPMNGRIKEISVSKGQTVDLGAALVVIENM